MSASSAAAYAANAKQQDTAAAAVVARCQEAIDHADYYRSRGGVDGDNWPNSAVSCAFAYAVTKNANYLTAAIKYWKASLNDDETIGDGKGCVEGVSTSWTGYLPGYPNPPAVIVTITHDTGYPIRWYGPFIALAYDWLYDAPGVDDALRAQTRTCLGAWVDWYSKEGYMRDQPGSNMEAGFVVAKALAGVAIGTDGASDGHIWKETLSLFSDSLVGFGLANGSAEVGSPFGPLVGGDWPEGWEYGTLSSLEYAFAARAVEEQGAALPEMDAWLNSYMVRYIHGTVPTNDAQYAGNGDIDNESVYVPLSLWQVDAVLGGPSSDQAAAWALAAKAQQKSVAEKYYMIWDAIAELRSVQAQDYRLQSPPPALWYLAKGTRTVYMRTSWDASAFWAVFTSSPHNVPDHHHFAAANFVLSRGGDHLIVDPSRYGEPSTLETNAVSADSMVAQGDYRGSQTDWSQADLPWARGTDDGVVAARSDFAKAFIYADTASDIPYAHREYAFLPEGEIVLIDRVRTTSSSRKMYLQFHANTAGKLKLNGSVASAPVGKSSQLAIHNVMLSGGTPSISKPPVGSCTMSCSYPCGKCNAARFAVDEYAVQVPGPFAVAVHVIDGLAADEAPAVVGSLNDDTYDPAPKQNAAVIGAAVNRGTKQTFVVASSAQDGASSDGMTYSIPASGTSRHIVFDAPEGANGQSTVKATANGERCVVSLGKGAGLAGHPLMFQVSSAAEGCKVSESTNVPPGTVPPGGGVTTADASTSPVGDPNRDAGPAGADASVSPVAEPNRDAGPGPVVRDTGAGLPPDSNGDAGLGPDRRPAEDAPAGVSDAASGSLADRDAIGDARSAQGGDARGAQGGEAGAIGIGLVAAKSSGCGCEVGKGARRPGGPLLLVLAVLGLGWTRRYSSGRHR